MALMPMARFGDIYASNLVQVSSNIGDLDGGGRWAVAIPFGGEPVLARFSTWGKLGPDPAVIGSWSGVPVHAWQSSLDRDRYIKAVSVARERIERGDVYQVNICRVRTAVLPETSDIMALDTLLRDGNPAPFGGALRLPEQRVHIASASPELFLSRRGSTIASGPIKGTAAEPAGISAKDEAENIMIVDLVRNDLSRCAETGSVVVSDLMEIQMHPGLVQLVSTITATLAGGVGWSELIDATFPPGSVTGAPKSTAVKLISELETEQRNFYCGAFGWVDADTQQAELAVAIRTFWIEGPYLKFGTGAGITWNSNAAKEWEETELKARRLAEVASWVM